MQKFNSFLLILTFILSACTSAPQVTVTSEVTVTSTPPPTETPIPTPTLYPQFAELQAQIDASGERFNLTIDGNVEDNGVSIPGLTVSPDGTMTLTVDGETVTLDPTKAVFDDENGFSYPGYEQNEDGNWLEAAPSADDVWEKAATKWKLTPEDYPKVVSPDGTTVWYDPATQKPVFVVGQGIKTATGETLQFSGHFELEWAKDMIAKSGICFKNEYVGANPYAGPASDPNNSWWNTINVPLHNAVKEASKKVEYSGNTQFTLFLGGENNCWAKILVKNPNGGTGETPKTTVWAFDLNKQVFYVSVVDGRYVTLPAIDK